MGKKSDMIEAARAISTALRDYVDEEDRERIQVFESSYGYLRAIVGSKKFRGMGVMRRQDEIWDYLDKNVTQAHLGHCFGVHPLDPDEYDEECFPQSSSSSLHLHIRGEELTGDVDE